VVDRDRWRPGVHCRTVDPFLHAFDIQTGREVWKGELPASGHATPMTYKVTATGRQLRRNRRRRTRENL